MANKFRSANLERFLGRIKSPLQSGKKTVHTITQALLCKQNNFEKKLNRKRTTPDYYINEGLQQKKTLPRCGY